MGIRLVSSRFPSAVERFRDKNLVLIEVLTRWFYPELKQINKNSLLGLDLVTTGSPPELFCGTGTEMDLNLQGFLIRNQTASVQEKHLQHRLVQMLEVLDVNLCGSAISFESWSSGRRQKVQNL